MPDVRVELLFFGSLLQLPASLTTSRATTTVANRAKYRIVRLTMGRSFSQISFISDSAFATVGPNRSPACLDDNQALAAPTVNSLSTNTTPGAAQAAFSASENSVHEST